MKVGTIPLIVHVPEIPPIKKRITMAVVTSPILPFIASSKSRHGTLKSHIASHTQIPAEKSKATWLAPRIASLPKMLISRARSATSVVIGINEIPNLDKDLRAISSNSLNNSTQYKNFFVIFMQDFSNLGFIV